MRLWEAGQEQVPLLERGGSLHLQPLLSGGPSQGLRVSPLPAITSSHSNTAAAPICMLDDLQHALQRVERYDKSLTGKSMYMTVSLCCSVQAVL